jgi:hypothetical protein
VSGAAGAQGRGDRGLYAGMVTWVNQQVADGLCVLHFIQSARHSQPHTASPASLGEQSGMQHAMFFVRY